MVIKKTCSSNNLLEDGHIYQAKAFKVNCPSIDCFESFNTSEFATNKARGTPKMLRHIGSEVKYKPMSQKVTVNPQGSKDVYSNRRVDQKLNLSGFISPKTRNTRLIGDQRTEVYPSSFKQRGDGRKIQFMVIEPNEYLRHVDSRTVKRFRE